MKKSRWFDPYARRNKTNLRPAKARSGVYLVRSKPAPGQKPKIVYVGMSQTDLYKTISRHFQVWDDPTQQRVTFPQSGYEIRIVFCTPRQAVRLEEALRANHMPSKNIQDLPEDWEPTDGHRTVYTDYLDCDFLTKDDISEYVAPF